MRLPQVHAPLTLGDLRQEVASVFGLPQQRTKLLLNGILLKDDRIPLAEYGVSTGTQLVLMTAPAQQQQRGNSRNAQGRQQNARTQAQGPADAAPPAQPPHAPPGNARPQPPVSAAQTRQEPGAGVPNADAGAAPAPPVGATAPVPTHADAFHDAPAEPPEDPETKHLRTIDTVVNKCRADLKPDLEHFERSVASYPKAKRGAAKEQSADANALSAKRIPLAQRTLSEFFLRELLRLDEIPVDSDKVRTARRAAVKEIQSYLDRVDAAWKLATAEKGIVSDV